MNDDELITAVRESVADVHTTTPVEQVLRRGRAVRARRRIPILAATLAVATAAAVAVTALLPASHPASHQPGAQLTAWTVAKRSGGYISITIRELDNPAGLQRELRADGVPASVTFHARHTPSSCRPYPAGRVGPVNRVFPWSHLGPPPAVIVIRPSALPTGAGVYLNDSSNPYGDISIHFGLVYASKQCTGS
jgi:hypothetical protein